jgi:RimJ/RimL family protein N-acetyltransferase
MISLLPFRPWHMYKINPREGVYDLTKDKDLCTRAMAYENLTSWTFVDVEDGVIKEYVAVGGVLPLWDRVGGAWMISTDVLPKHGKEISLIIADIFDRLFKTDYDRIQATVLVGFDVGSKWVERFGFEFEGCMRKWGPDGRDYNLYARVNK